MSRKLPTVTQGEVAVESVSLVRWGWNHCVFELDLHTKYAEVAAYSGTDIMLGGGEYTIKLNEKLKGEYTFITLPRRVRGWHSITEVARYTCRIVCWKEPRLYGKWARWPIFRGKWQTLDCGMCEDDLG